MKLLIMQYYPPSCYFRPLSLSLSEVYVLVTLPHSQITSFCALPPLMRQTVFHTDKKT